MISDFAWSGPATGRSQFGQGNALATMSNPVAQAYTEMFGDTADFGGGGSGVSSGVSSGVTGGTKNDVFGGWTEPDFAPGRAMRNIGRAVSLAAPAPIGMAIQGIGTLSDVVTANQSLEQLGMPGVNGLEAFAAQSLPDDMFGLETAAQQHDSALATAWDTDIANSAGNIGDAFGGWGGYEGSYNTGPGADYESEPGDSFGADPGTSPSDVDDEADTFGGADSEDEDEDDDSIICTELMRQGRLSKRLWIIGTKEFQGYWEHGKRGYYLWSVPVVRHLKAHPDSRFSAFIERLFNIRAEYVAARNGYRYRKTLIGAVVTKGMYGLCWSLAVCSALVHGFPHRRPRPEIVFGRRLMNHGRSATGVKFVQGDKKPLRGRRGLGDRRHSHLREAGVRSCQLAVHERVGLHQFRDKFRKNFGHLFVRWDANVRHFTRISLLAQTIGVVKTLKVGGAQHHAADAAGDQLCVCVETASVGQITGRLDWLEHVSRLLNLRGLSARGEHQGRHRGQYDIPHGSAAYTPSYEARNG